MITTIYNIVNIIFCLSLFYLNLPTFLIGYYTVLSIGAILLSYKVDQHVKVYPNTTEKLKSAVEEIFGVLYAERLINYIGSYACHSIIVLLLLNKFTIFLAITGVFIYRVMLLNYGKNKVKDEIGE